MKRKVEPIPYFEDGELITTARLNDLVRACNRARGLPVRLTAPAPRGDVDPLARRQARQLRRRSR